ncbi:hypothetical protein NBRC116583_13200 [Arenicella sp. 4NH20-0111]|uniref:hypothetical protein n=1 Tax=Arenicella sp. 4NH20-0111 TaxID=3127648 RepID=UPI00310343C1
MQKLFNKRLLVIAGMASMSFQVNAITMSGEEFKEYAAEEAYWVVSVDCENGSDPRVIQRKTDGNQWCAKELDGYCFDSKDDASKEVCGEKYSSAAEELNAQAKDKAKREQEARDNERKRREDAERAAAERKRAADEKRQNQISIDEQLLKIEQEKLSLRRQELELQRRAVEIRDALKGLDN